MEINKADLQAVDDVIVWLAEQVDDMSLEQAIEMRDALDALNKKIGMTRSLLEARALKLLDGQPAKIGNNVYMENSTGKWRPEHPKIRTAVVKASAIDENGEVLSGMVAAERAVDLCYELFVSPSTAPKAGGLKKMGLVPKDVERWEVTGRELKIVASTPEVDE